MTRRERVLIACALARELEKSWRSEKGILHYGEPFTVWHSLLMVVTALGPPGAIDIGGASQEYLANLRLRYREAGEDERGTDWIDQDIATAPYPVLLLTTLEVLTTMVRARWQINLRERELLAHATIVLLPWRAKKKRGTKLQKMFQFRPYRFKEPVTVARLQEEIVGLQWRKAMNATF